MGVKLYADYLWYEFGVHEQTGFVDIASSENDTILASVPPELAEKICAAHNESVYELAERYKKKNAA